MTTLIAAIAKNNVIGSNNDLPWYLPADLKHFKELTTDHVVIMGRKTLDSIVARIDRPLPNRTNVVVTRDEHFSCGNVAVKHTLREAIESYPDAYIIGGASIYEQAIDNANKLEITEVHADINGDVYFPAIDLRKWRETNREDHTADDKNSYDYSFVTYLRHR